MALLDYFFSSAAVDVVSIYLEDTYLPIFSDARAIKARVNENSQVMSHPVEDGTTISDHKVILPVEIELTCIISSSLYRITYEALRLAYEQSYLLTVQTRTRPYTSMIISAMPHDEDPEMHEAVSITIKLTEVITATYTEGDTPQVDNPSSAENSSTADGGSKQTTDVSASSAEGEKSSSILYDWAS